MPEIIGKGLSFNGRPDMLNHSYLNYAFDSVTGKVVYCGMGGTSVYNPDQRDWEYTVEQPFMMNLYYTKLVSTPSGVFGWERGFFGRFDARSREWQSVSVTGDALPKVTYGDDNAITYDAKRNVIWLLANDGYQKPNGKIWSYDLASGVVKAYVPSNATTLGIPALKEPRESVYLPQLDVILYNIFVNGNQFAFDPQNKRWLLLPIAKVATLGSTQAGLTYDKRRNLVWAMAEDNRIFVLRPPAAMSR